MANAKVVAIVLAVALLLAVCCYIVGIWVMSLTISLVALLLWLNMDVLLAKLVCWTIGRIPKRYRWTIDRIKLRPSWSEKDHGWSEITLVNWTWHNAENFVDDAVSPDAAFLLHIDELLFRLKLSSIPGALFEHKSIEISLMRAHGLRFNTHRNSQGALNLWQALDLPDDDVNVQSFTSQAFKYGGMQEDDDARQQDQASSPSTAAVVPLPPISTAATRAAAGFWKPEWGPRPAVENEPMVTASSTSSTSRWAIWRTSEKSGDLDKPLLQESKYVEEPIGHPRRRPRWGVPVRFDIHRIHLIDVHLWVLDLMLMDTHTTSQRMDRDKMRIGVHSLNISRTRLEAGDERRCGVPDGVHGVYLGELIWVIVAEVIPLVVKRAPGAIGRTAVLATGLAIKDGTKRLGAKAVEAAHHLGHNIKERLHLHHPAHADASRTGAMVHVHLIGGRQLTRKGYSVNSHAFIELLSPTGIVIAEARSEPQMWTKVPKWNEVFELGPASSANDMVRIRVYHQKSRQVVGFTVHGKETPERFMGEVGLPLRSLLIRDTVIAEGGEVVGWFQLNDTRGLRNGIPCSGQLKLGLRVVGADLLTDGDIGQLGHNDHTKSDWAILH